MNSVPFDVSTQVDGHLVEITSNVTNIGIRRLTGKRPGTCAFNHRKHDARVVDVSALQVGRKNCTCCPHCMIVRGD